MRDVLPAVFLRDDEADVRDDEAGLRGLPVDGPLVRVPVGLPILTCVWPCVRCGCDYDGSWPYTSDAGTCIYYFSPIIYALLCFAVKVLVAGTMPPSHAVAQLTFVPVLALGPTNLRNVTRVCVPIEVSGIAAGPARRNREVDVLRAEAKQVREVRLDAVRVPPFEHPFELCERQFLLQVYF